MKVGHFSLSFSAVTFIVSDFQFCDFSFVVVGVDDDNVDMKTDENKW
jgi:hypothetical protein